MPSLLGLRDLDGLVDPTRADRSSLPLEEALALARVFVPTRAYARASELLERHRFAVLTGPPEMGKTATARMLALTRVSEGWEAYEVTSPDALWRVHDPARRQLFVADDAFGSTEYRPDAAERWAGELPLVLEALDERHLLVWTSRPAPLHAGLRRVHRERGGERFPSPAQVQVDASDLDAREKVLILFRHAKAADLDQAALEVVRDHGARVVAHPHFTPERIRRFVSTRLPRLAPGALTPRAVTAAAVSEELGTPTVSMAASFDALDDEHRDLLVALLDAPPGPVEARDLAAAVRRHHAGGLASPPAELVDRLTDHFVRVTGASVTWVHPSWRDLVVDRLSAHPGARRRFLGAAGVDGALLALSTAGGSAGERALPLLREDADWDALAGRLGPLLAEAEDRDLARLMGGLAAVLAAPGLHRRVRAEAVALARVTLERARGAWDATEAPVPVWLLAGWLELAAGVEPPVELPRLSSTWVELLPSPRLDPELPVGLLEKLDRWTDWLAFVEVLATGAPEALERLAFPGAYGGWLDTLESCARFEAAGRVRPERGALLAQALEVVARVVPERRAESAYLAEALAPRVWSPPDEPVLLDPDEEDEPEPTFAEGRRSWSVARVLRDL